MAEWLKQIFVWFCAWRRFYRWEDRAFENSGLENFENIIKQDKLKVKVELDVSVQFSDEVKVHFWTDFITCDEKWMLYNSRTRSGHYSFLEQEDIVTVI